MGEFALDQPLSRCEDARLLPGSGWYVGDMVLLRIVFGYVLRSPHVHGRIRLIGRRPAKTAPSGIALWPTINSRPGWRSAIWPAAGKNNAPASAASTPALARGPQPVDGYPCIGPSAIAAVWQDFVIGRAWTKPAAPGSATAW